MLRFLKAKRDCKAFGKGCFAGISHSSQPMFAQQEPFGYSGFFVLAFPYCPCSWIVSNSWGSLGFGFGEGRFCIILTPLCVTPIAQGQKKSDVRLQILISDSITIEKNLEFLL